LDLQYAKYIETLARGLANGAAQLAANILAGRHHGAERRGCRLIFNVSTVLR